MEKQVLITVSREFGSGGHEVAAELAKRFGGRDSAAFVNGVLAKMVKTE